jgi:hypothetical protein
MDTITKLVGGACPNVATDVYTAAAKTSVINIEVSNPTGLTQGVTLQLNGATLFSVTMPSHGGVSFNGPQVLESGQKIYLVADSTSCTYNVTGVVIT